MRIQYTKESDRPLGDKVTIVACVNGSVPIHTTLNTLIVPKSKKFSAA